MSETVHYKGVLKKIERYENETLEDQCKRLLNGVELPSYYDSYEEFFSDERSDKAVIQDGIIYKVEKEEINLDIFIARKLNESEIEFELRYYDGGCSFNEAINEAFKNMKYNSELLRKMNG